MTTKSPKQATVPDYQVKALGFAVGQTVAPYGVGAERGGTVVAVYPGIGMVDVEFPHGMKRFPAEDLQRFDKGDVVAPAEVESTPAGPTASLTPKIALYWAGLDRQYRATKAELDSGTYTCPKCKEGVLEKTCYKRVDGKSEKLLGCRSCLFLIKRSDIIGDGGYVDNADSKKPFANRKVKGNDGKRVRLTWR